MNGLLGNATRKNAVLLGKPFQADVIALLGSFGGWLMFQFGDCKDDQDGTLAAEFGVGNVVG